CLESIIMHSRKHENRIATIAGAHCSHSITINEFLATHCVNGRKIILHYLATMILADLFIPFCTVTGHASSVRGNDDVSLRSHQLKIPTERIELRERRLWSTLAIKKGGIFL